MEVKMKYKRKIVLVTILSLLVTIIPFGIHVNAQSNIIYQSSTIQNITSGATLESIRRFTVNGWLSMQVLKVDLTNPNVKLDTLTHPESVSKTATVKSMVQSKQAVAGINGSFFSSSSMPGYTAPIGPVVESGTLKTASSDFNQYSNSMATFAVSKANEVLLNYWKTTITLYAPNGKTQSVLRYNKPVNGGSEYSILDRKFAATSVGAQPDGTNADIVEMVVDDGKVVDIREGKPAVAIPVNGYVVVTRKAAAGFICDNFKIGDTVEYQVNTTPDWNNLQMAISGGAVLLKDGVMPQPFSHLVNGRHPRTAIGSSKDGKQIFMVTVDGRQQGSIGMTLEELSQFMSELGAYNALNLDGGGSTTMVARKLGTTTLEIVNTPSDGVQRGVTSGVGVLSLAPPAPLDGLIIDTDDTNVFTNTSRSFTVRGYDRYFNPVSVNPDDVKWSVSGIQGTFTGNVFYPKSVGEGKIKATVGNISAELAISSLSSPAKLELSAQSVTLTAGTSKSFTVKGWNKNGYSALINPLDVQWKAVGDIGSFSGNVFHTTKGGSGYIEASIGAARAYCKVSSIPTVTTVIESFEQPGASFLGSSALVKGSFGLSSEIKYAGNSSGKLTYSYENNEGTRAAYVVMPGNGLTLQPNTMKIDLWVHNSHENSNWLRLEVYDDKNTKHLVDGLRVMDWSGWKYVEIPLTGIQNPARLTRVYIAQVNPVAESGTIYIDDISAVTVDTSAPVSTVIQPVTKTVVDSFENSNGVFLPYPSTVQGSYSISGEQKKSGSSSGKLSYTFTDTNKSQAAYLLYSGNGLNIEQGITQIGLWAHNSLKDNPGWLRAEVIDAAGNKQYVTFTENIDWTGWKYIEAPLQGIKLPAQLTRLYLVNIKSKAASGNMYFDDLTFIGSLSAPADINKIPADTVLTDEANKAVEYKKGTEAFRFAVFGQSREPQNDIEKLVIDKLIDKTNKYIEIASFVGNSKHEGIQRLTKPALATSTGYKSVDMPSSRLIQLDMSKQSLRTSNQAQWHWLLNQLDTFNGKNVFLFLADSPQSFSDSLEATLLKETLTQYRQKKFKNVWVFFKGKSNTSYMERGVKYISTSGYEVDGLTPEKSNVAQYVLVTVMGENVTFQFKPVID